MLSIFWQFGQLSNWFSFCDFFSFKIFTSNNACWFLVLAVFTELDPWPLGWYSCLHRASGKDFFSPNFKEKKLTNKFQKINPKMVKMLNYQQQKSNSGKICIYQKISRIRETPTLSTDADSRTDTILERLRDLPIHTEKRTWSTQKCGLGPR